MDLEFPYRAPHARTTIPQNSFCELNFWAHLESKLMGARMQRGKWQGAYLIS